jgi:hypothetical protein
MGPAEFSFHQETPVEFLPASLCHEPVREAWLESDVRTCRTCDMIRDSGDADQTGTADRIATFP